MSNSEARRESSGAWASWLWLLPLGLFSAFHALAMTRAAHGRDAFVAGSPHGGWLVFGVLAVALPLLALARATMRGEALPGSPGHTRLHALTGGLSLAFAAALTSLAVAEGDATSLYARLADVLSRSSMVLAYAVGAVALALTLAEGVSGVLARRGGRFATTAFAWACALGLFAAQVHGLGHFAAGRGLFLSPQHVEAAP